MAMQIEHTTQTFLLAYFSQDNKGLVIVVIVFVENKNLKLVDSLIPFNPKLMKLMLLCEEIDTKNVKWLDDD